MTAYDIRTKAYLLKKSKGGKFHCPVCGGANLNIQHSSGAYKCYSNECSEKAIREAIDALEGKEPYKPNADWQKPPRKQQKTEYFYPARDGSNLAKVTRIDDGEGGKRFIQAHYSGQSWINTMPQEIRSEIPIYNYQRVQEAIAEGQVIWVVEGEGCVDVLAKLGIVATTTIGGSSGFSSYGEYSQDLVDSQLFLCPDRDSKGLEYIANWGKLGNVGGYYLAGSEGLWANPMGGMDISDDLADHGYTVEQLLDRIITPDKFKELTEPKSPINTPTLTKIHSAIATEIEEQEFLGLAGLRKPKADPSMIYPQRLAEMMDRDAMRQNIDPASYSVYLLPAVASLMGITTLQLGGGFDVPNIIWSVLIQPSGGGKSRAEELMKKPLMQWERENFIKFQQAMTEYNKSFSPKKGSSLGLDNFVDPADKPNIPLRRKYLFEVATIQSVTKLLADQWENGSIWIRDEIKGLFSSLSQFNRGGDSEGVEILLQLWGGGGNVVDRVDYKDSYVGSASRLSIAGGVQPAVLSRIFDPDDPQGLFARFLPVIPAELPVQLYRGELELKREITALYHWVKSQHWCDLLLSPDAEEIFDGIHSHLGNMASPSNAIRAWQKKASGQVGRVAIALHAIDCYYSGEKLSRTVQADTLERAYGYVLTCLDAVYQVNGVMADNDNTPAVSALLQKIIDKADHYPDGINLKDLYRNINSIRTLAKKEGVKISDLTLSLCQDLERLGKGSVIDIGGSSYVFKSSSCVDSLC